MQKVLVAVLVGLSCQSGPGMVQHDPRVESDQPVTVISTYRVKPGERDAFLEEVRAVDLPVFEELRAAGTILAWGLRESLFHEEGGHGLQTFWVTLPSSDELDDFLRRLDQVPDSARFRDAVDFSGHASTLCRDHLIFGVGGGGD